MNKRTSLAVVFIILCFSLYAQPATFKIAYGFYTSEDLANVDLENEPDESKKELALTALLAQMFVENDKPIIQLWANDEFLRINTNGPLKNEAQITNKKTGESYQLYPEVKQYALTSATSDKLLDMGDDIALASDFPVTYVNGRTKHILGYACELAQVRIEVDRATAASMDIWYSKDLPTVFWGEYPYLEGLPGAALEISTNGLGIQSTQIEKVNGDPSLFEIPADYTKLDYLGEDSELSEFGDE